MRATTVIEYLLSGVLLLAAQTQPAGIFPSATAQGQSVVAAKTLTFESKVHDFGKITEEDGQQTCIFKYRNNSNVAIVIQKVIVSCACTQVEWPEKPIKPGESGGIKVFFSNRIGTGNFDKSISVSVSSCPYQTVLRVRGVVTDGGTTEKAISSDR